MRQLMPFVYAFALVGSLFGAAIINPFGFWIVIGVTGAFFASLFLGVFLGGWIEDCEHQKEMEDWDEEPEQDKILCIFQSISKGKFK